MIKNLIQSIGRNVFYLPGWHTSRKIVVIESDDWGSIRMASTKAYKTFLQSGYPVDQSSYNRNDALECNEDLEFLFEVLSSVKDKYGNPAVMTINNIVANPDFEKIKCSDFQKYYYELFTETLKRYPKHEKVFDLYKEGMNHKVFHPQFHGREHLNVNKWMKALLSKDLDAHSAFVHNMFSIHTLPTKDNGNEYMDSLNYSSVSEKEQLDQIIIEGLSLFKKIWGYPSKSFIASCYIWDNDIERTLFQNGVKYIQGLTIQRIPAPFSVKKYSKKYHYQGQKNSLGQRYLIRNAFFEPSESPDFDYINDCLKRISISFRWHKPAIIGTHRQNFVGFINTSNRDRNLNMLKILLTEILHKWPEVEFMTSDQLGDLMNGEKTVI